MNSVEITGPSYADVMGEKEPHHELTSTTYACKRKEYTCHLMC